MSLLEVENLSVTFSTHGQKLHAVRGISFEVQEGESVGIVGESGSGKSAAVQAIMRLTTGQVTGQIFFEGKEQAMAAPKNCHGISRSDDRTQSHDENRRSNC